MGDPWADAGLDRDTVLEDFLGRWEDDRRTAGSRAEADRRFRGFLWGEVAAAVSADDHAFLVFELAMGLAERERPADAFLLFSWLAEAYAGHRDELVAWRVIMGLTDDCVAIAMHYRTAEANAAARQVIRLVLDHVGPPGRVRVDRAAVRALVQLAHLRGGPGAPEENEIAEVARLWAEVAERWAASTDPEVRERAAQGWVNRGFVALQGGDEAGARRMFAEVLARFGADPAATEQLHGYVVIAGHAGDILDRLVIDGPEFRLDFLERQRRFFPDSGMDAVVEFARSTHVRSVGAVRSWVCSGEPFVLLLRNYDLTERSGVAPDWFVEPGEPDHLQVMHHAKAEKALMELAGGVPLVQVASTTAGELELAQYGQFTVSNRLYLPDATWFATVSRLIAVAAQVIVWANELTPSLERELAELAAHRRTEDTLVVVEPPDAGLPIFLPRSDRPPLTADHPVLAAFPHRVAAADFAGLGVAEWPAMLGVVERLRGAGEEPVPERLARIRSRLDATR
ncbi:hypothetical protein M8542_12365 [Amycolatopsis sp. OK19-0408]|uniref:Uncharacterized protein n=1 Tax=Amycolatopsis iheyensis TaxID=2945988 RepID=A0A9X2SK91_9PSEU|nr:hypothetical protein [Amycolatopsis iheyensis]MCR6483611.1 hypothetical protein [Amycolatopsis iheyensis]